MGLKRNGMVDLKGGDVVTLRNGDELVFDEYYDKITNTEDSRTNYDYDLEHKSNSDYDIVKVERPVKFETIYEADDDETIYKKVDDEELDELVDKFKKLLKDLLK